MSKWDCFMKNPTLFAFVNITDSNLIVYEFIGLFLSISVLL